MWGRPATGSGHQPKRIRGFRRGFAWAFSSGILTWSRSERWHALQNSYNSALLYNLQERQLLLIWHEAEWVGECERHRIAVIFGRQANRNPFIDDPALARPCCP